MNVSPNRTVCTLAQPPTSETVTNFPFQRTAVIPAQRRVMSCTSCPRLKTLRGTPRLEGKVRILSQPHGKSSWPRGQGGQFQARAFGRGCSRDCRGTEGRGSYAGDAGFSRDDTSSDASFPSVEDTLKPPKHTKPPSLPPSHYTSRETLLSRCLLEPGKDRDVLWHV